MYLEKKTLSQNLLTNAQQALLQDARSINPPGTLLYIPARPYAAPRPVGKARRALRAKRKKIPRL